MRNVKMEIMIMVSMTMLNFWKFSSEIGLKVNWFFWLSPKRQIHSSMLLVFNLTSDKTPNHLSIIPNWSQNFNSKGKAINILLSTV